MKLIWKTNKKFKKKQHWEINPCFDSGMAH